MSKPDGTYPATISYAYVAEDQWSPGEYVLKLDCNIEDGGAVTCRQSMTEDDKGRRAGVLKALGLSWPFGSADLAALNGKGIDVNLKTSAKGNQNAYVATMREERILTPEELDRLAMPKEDLPF